jgi:hypothetical protein
MASSKPTRVARLLTVLTVTLALAGTLPAGASAAHPPGWLEATNVCAPAMHAGPRPPDALVTYHVSCAVARRLERLRWGFGFHEGERVFSAGHWWAWHDTPAAEHGEEAGSFYRRDRHVPGGWRMMTMTWWSE